MNYQDEQIEIDMDIVNTELIELTGHDDDDNDDVRVIVEPKRARGRPRKYADGARSTKSAIKEYNATYYERLKRAQVTVSKERAKQLRRRELLKELAELDAEDVA